MKKRITYTKLLITGMLAFLCSVLFTGFKIKGSITANKEKQDQWVREKKLAAILCSPYVTAFTDNSMHRDDEFRRSDDRLVGETEDLSSHRCPPVDPQNGNGCSHQQGSLCETNYSKRKILKIHC